MYLNSQIKIGAGLLALASAFAAVPFLSSTSIAASSEPALSVLDRAATPSDLMPDRKMSLAAIAEHVPQLDVAKGRVLRHTADVSIALVPRTDGMTCLAISQGDGGGGVGCSANDIVRRQGIVQGAYGLAVGVAPDGVKGVRFELTDGSFQDVTVGATGFYSAPAEAIHGTFEVDGQPVKLDFVPRSALPKGAVPDKFGNIIMGTPDTTSGS